MKCRDACLAPGEHLFVYTLATMIYWELTLPHAGRRQDLIIPDEQRRMLKLDGVDHPHPRSHMPRRGQSRDLRQVAGFLVAGPVHFPVAPQSESLDGAVESAKAPGKAEEEQGSGSAGRGASSRE